MFIYTINCIYISLHTQTCFLAAIVNRILKQSNLEELSEYPLCLKQIEMHWKIMATTMRCSQQPQYIEDRGFDRVFHQANQRGHFVNLNIRSDPLANYLMGQAEFFSLERIKSIEQLVESYQSPTLN